MPGKVLVVVVDLDDDLGSAGIETPVIGWEAALKAALAYALKRPEDSDLNAVFAGLQVYNKLVKEGKDAEICIVSGSREGGIDATLRVRKQLEDLLEKMGDVEGIILVSDGVEDEQVVPVIQSLKPILGVKRVIVEQLRGVEETYILLARYLKKALFEPRFSKLFLGVPGIILVVSALLSAFGLIEYVKYFAMFMIGVAMVIRGFGLEERLQGLWSSSPVMFISYILSGVLLSAAIGISYYIVEQGPVTVAVIGDILGYAAPLLGFSVISLLVGRMLTKLLEDEMRIWYEILGIVLVLLVVLAFSRLSSALKGLPANPSPSEIVSTFIESGAFSILFGGIAVVGLLTMIARAMERRIAEEESKR